MSFIKVEKISYSYPVPEELEEDFGGRKHLSAGQEVRTAEPKQPAYVLDDVSLEAEAGQFICILGRNGSGKSTLARHLNALLIPDKGTVWIDGKDTRDEKHTWEIRSGVGMVFQNPDNQIIGSVVEEDVAFGLENLGVPSEEIRKRVAAVLSQVGMADYAKRSPNHLSGGQKQRIAIAGILAMEPKCIVLDEATAMLDPGGREEVMSMAEKLNKEKGITVIAITHYMEEAVRADRVFVMDHGKIRLSGTPQEIFSRETEMKALGLNLPQACKLAGMLRQQGLSLPEGILTKDALVEAILKEYTE